MMCVASGARMRGGDSLESTGANMTSASNVGISKAEWLLASHKSPSLFMQSDDFPDGFLRPLKFPYHRLLLLDFDVSVWPVAARWRSLSKRYLRSADSVRKSGEQALKSPGNARGHDAEGGR